MVQDVMYGQLFLDKEKFCALKASITFRNALLDTGDIKLAEGREDMIWGSRLNSATLTLSQQNQNTGLDLTNLDLYLNHLDPR